MSQINSRALLMTIPLLLTLGGCREIPTSAKIGNGPSFLFTGSGRLASFRIYGPRQGHKISTPFDEKSLVWRVQPADGYFKGEHVQRLKIEYGQLPRGYVQTVPISGTAPTLAAGHVYYYYAETTNAPPAEGFFYMEESAAIEMNVPGLCQNGFIGEVKPLKCGTSEPYTEPTDLEQFVRENRVQK